MANRNGTFFDRLRDRRGLKRWQDLADGAETTRLEALRLTLGRARTLRRQLEQGGIASALLNELEIIAGERECTQMILVTETDRRDACAFYEASGFLSGVNSGYKKKLR